LAELASGDWTGVSAAIANEPVQVIQSAGSALWQSIYLQNIRFTLENILHPKPESGLA